MASFKLSPKGVSEVKLKRKSQGITHGEMAKSAYLSISTVKRFISGKPVSTESFKVLCNILEIEEWQNLIEQENIDSKQVLSRDSQNFKEKDTQETGTLYIMGDFNRSQQRQIKVALESLKALMLEGTVTMHISYDEDILEE